MKSDILLSLSVAGTGRFFGGQRIDNRQLGAYLGLQPEWIRRRSGIAQRVLVSGPVVDEQLESPTTAMSEAAARDALDMAGLHVSDIDLIVLATTTPDQTIPGTASTVGERLGVECGTVDLNAGCAGFVFGLVTVASLLNSGAVQRVLLIGADTLSRSTDWSDPGSAFLFGDGAAALILEGDPTSSAGLLSIHMGGNAALASTIFAPHGGGMRLQGREVFRAAVRAASESCRSVLDAASIPVAAVSCALFHQANSRISDAIAAAVGLGEHQVLSTICLNGNTSAASIPLGWHEAARSGRLSRGDTLLVSGFGAGMNWASTVLRLG